MNPASKDNRPGNSLQDQCVLLVGGSGGIGKAIGQALLADPVRELIIASPRPAPLADGLARASSETVDVADPESVRALAARIEARDVGIVINCAGINGNCRVFSPDTQGLARREMDVNYFGLLNLAQVFGPVLRERGGGTFMTFLSFVSHVNLPLMATYSASKAAAHSLLQALRAELAPYGVVMCGVYPTAVDTEMTRDFDGPKESPSDLARVVIESLVAGAEDVYPGAAAAARAGFVADPKATERAMAQSVRGT